MEDPEAEREANWGRCDEQTAGEAKSVVEERGRQSIVRVHVRLARLLRCSVRTK